MCSMVRIASLLYLINNMKRPIPTFLFLIVIFAFLIGCGGNSETSQTPHLKEEPKDKVQNMESKKAINSPPNILFYGNSLTAGLGVDSDDAFVTLIQNKIDEIGKNYKCINAGLSGETTAGGNNRINWVLRNNNPTIFVLELGGNDGLRGIDPKSSKQNLQSILDAVKTNNADTKILLAGMEAPPNMGADYTASFRSIYSELSKENEIPFIPFLLDRVGGIKELNQADGIHPNEKGQVIVAENIWKYLEPMI